MKIGWNWYYFLLNWPASLLNIFNWDLNAIFRITKFKPRIQNVVISNYRIQGVVLIELHCQTVELATCHPVAVAYWFPHIDVDAWLTQHFFKNWKWFHMNAFFSTFWIFHQMPFKFIFRNSKQEREYSDIWNPYSFLCCVSFGLFLAWG